jgi:transposase
MSITMIGLDTAKSVFQVHGVNETGKVEIRRKLRRSELIPFFEKQQACTVVMEACGAAHHWARVLSSFGHEVKLKRWEFPRLCRGGSRSLTFPGVCPGYPLQAIGFIKRKSTIHLERVYAANRRNSLVRVSGRSGIPYRLSGVTKR